MLYLEYETTTKQVVEIHETVPTTQSGYDYALSEDFLIGDEFEKTIWINEVDENKYITSYSAIRNNPNAKRLLQENEALTEKTVQQAEQISRQEQQITELNLQDIFQMELLIEKGLV